MANQTVTANSVVVHGRGSLVIDFVVHDALGAQIDISAWPLVFEVDGIPITTPLIPNPNDPKGQLIELTRTQVATLKKNSTRFALIDTSRADADMYRVLWEGTIARNGYVGDPDGVDD